MSVNNSVNDSINAVPISKGVPDTPLTATIKAEKAENGETDPIISAKVKEIKADNNVVPASELANRAKDLAEEFGRLENSQLANSFGIEIAVDEDGAVVKLVDKETGDLIRQIPPKETLHIRDRIREITTKFDELKGVLFSNEV